MTEFECDYADAIHTICLCVFNSMLMLSNADNETVLHLCNQMKRDGTLCLQTQTLCTCISKIHPSARLTVSLKYER